MSKESIDKLARTLADSVPEGLRAVRDDLEGNFRAVLKSGLDKLDLVTREEFEVQQAVLARTREKLEALDTRLAGMESPPGEKPAKRKAAKKTGAAQKGGKKTG